MTLYQRMHDFFPTDRLEPYANTLSPGAIFSDDKSRRYLLWRRWSDGKKRMLFVMLNPSTADAIQNDRTIYRCIGFAAREEYGAMEVVNLLSQRTPYPSDVSPEPEPEEADKAIALALLRCQRVVFAWGALSGLAPEARRIAQDRAAVVAGMARASRALGTTQRAPECFGVTKGGEPKHPLYLRGSTALVPYDYAREEMSAKRAANSGGRR